jgi:hypothetical protein
MFKILYIIILLIIILLISIKLSNKNENLTMQSSESESPPQSQSQSQSQPKSECCNNDSSTNLTILINNLNTKYDSILNKYSILQEEIKSNSQRIDYVYDEYESANKKLKMQF